MINYILSLVIIQFRLSTSWIKFGKLSSSKSFSIFLCFQIYCHNISIIFFYHFFSHCSFLFLSLFICTLCPFSVEAFLSLINFINHFKDLWVAFADLLYCINELFCFINCCSRLYYHLPLGFFPFFSFSNFLSWILVH